MHYSLLKLLKGGLSWSTHKSHHPSSFLHHKSFGTKTSKIIDSIIMEFFNAAKVVRLQSHLGKYLIADSNEESVYQGRSENCKESQWTVELVEGNSHIIRLKSCHGLYLSTSDDPFLLGMTGKKVIQSFPKKRLEYTVEWEPIRDGDLVKLRTKGGKFLRANGAMPPWRNSITYDVPHRTATQDWVLWDVKVVDLSLNDSLESLPTCLSSESSLSSLQDDFADSDSPSRAAQDGMQYLQKAKAIRLQSHHGKYLVADDDEKTVRQSRNGSSHKSHWTVELVKGQNITAIRLKSCHGLYLTGTDEPFLLGVTGKKVIQASDSNNAGFNQWVSIKETAQFIKLRSKDGNFLRANRGMPPYRNSITYDVPHRTLTQNWVLWRVDVVDINLSSLHSSLSSMSSIDFSDDDFAGTPDNGSPSFFSIGFRRTFGKQRMEFFQHSKTVRLRSYHEKFLLASSDEESVYQDRQGTVKKARWTVEFVEGYDTVIRLKSCFGQYLTASEEQRLLGVTGRRVLQTRPRKLDSSVEWEPVRDGMQVRLKSRYGNFLRANGLIPPWRKSITHDIPHRHSNWVKWEVDVLEKLPDSPAKVPRSECSDLSDLSTSSFHLVSNEQSEQFESGSPVKAEGRMIYYHVANDDGKVDDNVEASSFAFKGIGLEELTEKLEDETGIENIIVCSRNRIDGKIYPLHLALPPNNATMHIVVVPSTTQAAREFVPGSP